MAHVVHTIGDPERIADERTFSPRARAWLRRIGLVLGAFALLVVVAWLAIPPVVRWQLQTQLTEALGRRTTVGSVRFNPFELRLTLHNLAVAGRDSATPLLAVDELVADLSSASIWHRAPVLDALTIAGPRVSIGRDRAGVLDVQDLIDRASAAPAGPPRRFSLNNVQITDGTLTFDDGVTGRKQSLASLAVGVPFLSSLPYETAIHVTPHVSGAFNGSHFLLEGNTTPFTEHRETTVDIDVDALPLAPYVDYLPAKPRVRLASGALTTRLKLVFVDGQAGERRLELRGDARIDAVALRRPDDTPLASAKAVAVTIDRLDLMSGETAIATLTVDTPVVDVKRRTDGTLEWAQPLFERAAGASAASAGGTPRFSIAKIDVAAGSVSLDDDTTGFQSKLDDVSVSASNVSNVPGRHANVKLAFVSADRVASFSGEADVEPTVPAATGHLSLSRFRLALLFPYYKSALAVDVQNGSLDVDSAFSLDRDGNLRFAGGTATLSDLRVSLQGAREPLWQAARLAATAVDVDVNARNVTAGSVVGQNVALRLVRERDGSLAAARIVRAHDAATAREDTSWKVLAKKLALDGGAIDFEDRVPETPVKVAVRDLAFTATDVDSAGTGSSHVTLKGRVGARGRLAFIGDLSRSPLRLAGDVDGAGLSLTSVRAYVEPLVNVVFTEGVIAAKGRVGVDATDASAITATWKGDVTVTDFAALDKPTASDLARWKSLALQGVDVSTRPFRLAVNRIGAEDFFARVIVYPDATLNVTRLLTPGDAPQPEPGATPAPSAPASRARLPITIGRIDFDRGNVSYTDLFVKPNYTANLTEVQGSVSTMSDVRAGDVSIVARVDHSAPVEVQGTIAPFGEELALDVHGKASDIDLPPLTPYSVKYAGYGITKGKLTFDVHYQVEQRRLKAENHLVLDQLTFGEHVDSPTATKLPVLLAVSLLKDVHGVIDIHLPIAGSLDDPKFSVGGLIVQVIVNLLTKAATAPFALLTAAFGHGEELSTLPFAAGSARVEGDAEQRIDALAKVLAQRPGVKLQIAGRVDPAADREALRREAVETSLKRAKMKALAKEGNAPASIDDVTIAADERNRWLAEAYRDAPIADRPRNVLGMLKDVPPAEMEAMLYAKTVVDDDAVRQLATRRGQAVKDAIAQRGVADERLFLLAPRVGGDAKDAPGAPLTRVDLALG